MLAVATVSSCSKGEEYSNVEQGSIEINKDMITLLQECKDTLNVALKPLNSEDTCVWASDNNDIAIVDQKGVVTAKGKGTANISVKAGKLMAKCVVTVTEIIPIKDNAFKAFLMDNIRIHTGTTDGITVNEARDFFGKIDISGKTNITDLSGLEHFINIAILNCSNTGIKAIDVSQNTRLLDLDCSNCKDLKGSGTTGSELDISKNTGLKYFNCTGTPKLKILVWKEFKSDNLITWAIDTSGEGLDTTEPVN